MVDIAIILTCVTQIRKLDIPVCSRAYLSAMAAIVLSDLSETFSIHACSLCRLLVWGFSFFTVVINLAISAMSLSLNSSKLMFSTRQKNNLNLRSGSA